MGKFAELYEEEQRREDRIDTRMYEEEDKINKNLQEILKQDPELEKIIESSEEELKTDINQIFAEIISDIRLMINKLNDDDCYKLTLKLKDWFNKNVHN